MDFAIVEINLAEEALRATHMVKENFLEAYGFESKTFSRMLSGEREISGAVRHYLKIVIQFHEPLNEFLPVIQAGVCQVQDHRKHISVNESVLQNLYGFSPEDLKIIREGNFSHLPQYLQFFWLLINTFPKEMKYLRDASEKRFSSSL